MKKLLAIVIIVSGFASTSFAGNKDRAGQAGASELLINPWSRSSGWNGLNTAGAMGLEAMNLNVAGLAGTKKTEILFSRTNWLAGSGVNINAFGFSQKLGENEDAGVLGLSVMSVGFGDIDITTSSLPEGGIGTYSPQFVNVALGYAKIFSKSIYGGFTIKGISESISDVTAMGLALDAGVQYKTGKKDRLKFGVVLRNIGTPMKYGGDGLSFRANGTETGATTPNTYSMTVEQRTQGFELPSMLNIGCSYDLFSGKEGNNRLTFAGNFTSNSFSNDQLGLGLEYSIKELFMLRAGYNYEKGILSNTDRVTVMTGIAAGLTVDVPVKAGGPQISLDYSYRSTNPWNGIHSVGIRITL